MNPSLPARALLLSLLLLPTMAGASELPALLSAAGIRPVDPPSPATAFELPSLDGSPGSLEGYRGRWVLLTFFASWCGPCRMEMPSLQRLHDRHADAGFQVLGVSVDDSRAAAQRFVDDLGLRFPVLWDQHGKAARDYRASSIPLSYLIDPEGRVVGVVRGSRDWSAADDLVAGLLGTEPMPEGEQVAAASAPVELPPDLEPPTMRWELPEPSVRPGQPFLLELRIDWAGRLDEMLLHPPEVTLPEGVRQTGITAESTSREGRSVLRYSVTLEADRAGRFDLDPIEIRYTPAFEDQPLASRIAGPTVEVVAPTIVGLRPPVAAAVGGGGVAVCGLAFWGLATFRRRRSIVPDAGPYPALREAFDAARKLRLDGDAAGCLESLIALERRLDAALGTDLETGSEGGSDPELTELLERLRFGGWTPTGPEVDARLRHLERRIDALRPAAESTHIRYRPGAEPRATVHHAGGDSR